MATSKPDLNVDLNYRQLADRYDFKELHAMHGEYLRLVDKAMRHNKGEAEIKRLHRIADVYQQAITHKDAEGEE